MMRSSWIWFLLGLALIWAVYVRIPMVQHAETHLDGDLAVDGLTLAEAMSGHWHWHYPGTPHMGTLPILASLPAARVLGLSPSTLVTGGVVLFGLDVIAVFLLAWRAFGARVAAWTLAPLAFSSPGLIWLSGRITGGHLLAVAWHATALTLLVEWLKHGTPRVAALLGLACGLALWSDEMAIFTILAVLIGAWIGRSRHAVGTRRLFSAWLSFAVALTIGFAPRIIGEQVDSHDAYHDQFVTIFRPFDTRDHSLAWKQAGLLAVEHLRILGEECLPRLIAGARWPGSETLPSSIAPGTVRKGASRPEWARGWGMATLAVGFLGSAVATLGLTLHAVRRTRPAEDPQRIARAIASALVLPGLLVVLAFVLNRNIFNSDNYRYLVLLVVPHAVGFGLACEALWSRHTVTCVLLVTAMALAMTVQTYSWYASLGWLGGPASPRGQLVAWMRSHPEVRAISGSYWDIYPLSFRMRIEGLGVQTVPLPGEPHRFDERGPRPRYLIVADRGGLQDADLESLIRRGRVQIAGRIGSVVILVWPDPDPRRLDPTEGRSQ